MGGAKPALVDGKKHPDPGCRRARALLPRPGPRSGLRVDRFLTDADGKSTDLPLLKAYREQVGTDESEHRSIPAFKRMGPC